jgi:hypothetical protein
LAAVFTHFRLAPSNITVSQAGFTVFELPSKTGLKEVWVRAGLAFQMKAKTSNSEWMVGVGKTVT